MSHESCSEGILNLGDSCPDLPSSPFAEYLTLDSHLEAHNDIFPHPWPPTIQVAMKGPPLQPTERTARTGSGVFLHRGRPGVEEEEDGAG